MAFDVNDPADLLELKTEIETDPTGLGYSDENTSDDIALINDTQQTITVSKPKISSALVRSETTFDAYNNLSIDEQEWLRWMTGSNGFEEENLTVTPDLRTQLTGPGPASIWAVADRDEMNTVMLSLIDVDGSRAEELFGYGASISINDWIAARNS